MRRVWIWQSDIIFDRMVTRDWVNEILWRLKEEPEIRVSFLSHISRRRDAVYASHALRHAAQQLTTAIKGTDETRCACDIADDHLIASRVIIIIIISQQQQQQQQRRSRDSGRPIYWWFLHMCCGSTRSVYNYNGP